ncbi:putative toxin-antitoxin system toxin component, PIN family [Chamaesiphon polymorphus]|uniref:Putative toxin-antitoxin system toxin component, PIN family n=1 Tax=Chamaesiphon polymorphus CCALA 037 TaxID=2107692 RepID=A0A2T1GG12_9CYAN|nr:putative toxin-antitoxin system toxin component, PIN family [Chamaesiphon polymorphus]PSB56465.1 putative toxin-antitoxin system toxin component, PIN family [Chamaesiphon polymorphus CCALA 037]
MSPEFIVIDTNIFISAALSPNGTAYQAFAQAVQKFTIVQSDETYQEIADRIYKNKFDKYISNERREEFLNLIKNQSKFIQPISQITSCRDPDDNKFLELAIDSNAKFLITGDKDLLTLKSQAEYRDLIISARDFIEIH